MKRMEHYPQDSLLTTHDRIAGCLLGSAVGDAIGLPYEGLSVSRAKRFAKLPLRHRFAFGHGMVSDDTDHTIFVAQSLIRSRGDVDAFRRCLAWRLRWWLLCLPAGIGWATLRAIIRMWFGFKSSGVFSAGNGPSMRSAIIAAAFPTDAKRRRSHVETSTRLTHTDPKALAGALAVAEVAARIISGAWQGKPTIEEFVALLGGVSPDPAWQEGVAMIRDSCESLSPVTRAEQHFGMRQGISGYVLHSVPFALVAWYHHAGNYRATIEAITQAGGDVDTVAAIGGALAGATVGESGVPSDWVGGIVDWPHGTSYLRKIAASISDESSKVSTRFSPWLALRGLAFTLLVLAHGFRRLLPPYR
jgi:ADP-ribosyl-[dinitrogen reductase] hydrolase